ncbi:phosphoadenosine phosphosulfate reductase family protein [Paenibacillus chibensis]|uniref:phosphoadenosine phosphosulfate reductase family protein n=1 Tax=Paenibacillus chibensis TaxID=59846 RepID=UPI000FDBC7C6|nr:phosphoadenosine phosphosulfate reductase family protein [Paenibacillus chibensis]MEC0370027.1 phosphoadenosine phosphosulfate reductase family protein [Paenibacillus chibensis]
MEEYAMLTTQKTRLVKDTIVAAEDWHKTAALDEKEARSLDLVRTVLRKGIAEYGDALKVVVSCSFGIDSIITLHLVRTVAAELGISFDTVWNNTLNEYPQTRQYAKKMTQEWALSLIEARPETTLKKIYEENGVDTLFKRKGDRRGEKGAKEPVVEKCCGALKHKPMQKAIKENGWHIMFNGVRSGESRQRWMAGRRDGDFFYSSHTWKTWVCRPIQWWTALTDSFNYGNNWQEDVWEYVRKHAIPYSEIYDMNAVIDDRYEGPTAIVDRVTAERLVAEGYNVFMPRTGCQACPIPIKRGYLRYLREVFPKTYRSMLFQFGFAKALIAEMPEEQRAELMDELSSFGIISEKTEEAVLERLEEIIEWKPCVFDGVGVDKRKKPKEAA